MRSTRELSERRKQFCREYVIDFNAGRAAKAAGYSGKTARANVYRMLGSPEVVDEIRRLIDERAERTRISADRVVVELAAVAFSSVADYRFNEAGEVELGPDADPLAFRAVASVRHRECSRGSAGEVSQERATTLRLWDKVAALRLLMRHLGMLDQPFGRSRNR